MIVIAAGNRLGTAITAVHLAPREAITDSATLGRHTALAAGRYCDEATFRRFDRPLLANARILAWPGMTTAALFTPRNFSLLAELAREIHHRDMPGEVRDVLMAILTSGVASSSRLIPYRDNLAGGGPAWTVPGFWVPPLHLERNPAAHMKARAAKVLAGLDALFCGPGLAAAAVKKPTYVMLSSLTDPESQARKPDVPWRQAERGSRLQPAGSDPSESAKVPSVQESGLSHSEPGAPPQASPVTVFRDDSASRIRELVREGTRVKYIFADPPYGDSVPYLEFSQIWNCWLPETAIAFDREAVVSDRAQHPSRWAEYRDRLAAIFAECRAILAADGYLTLTFNNLDGRAWGAILFALQSAEFWCVDVAYQVPAVVPAKASFAPTSSYLGDLYATFRKKETSAEYGDWPMVEERLRQAALLRGGAVSRATQMKVASLTILEANVAADWIPELERHLAGLPRRTPQLPESCPLYLQVLAAIESATQRATPSDAQLCAAVAASLPAWLALDRHEILRVARCRQ